MNRIRSAAAFLFLTLFVSMGVAGEATPAGKFKVSSPAFEPHGVIPKKFGCDGENVNPPLQFENVPPGAKSMALIFDDIDAPRGTYVHWILWNIDPGTKEIKENSIPGGAIQGMNDFKKQNYGGPCPPTRPHRYVFKAYAVDTVLSLNPASTKPELEKSMEGHILDQAQLKGSYRRK